MYPDHSNMTTDEKFLWIVYEESYCDYDKRLIHWIKTEISKFLDSAGIAPDESQLHFWSMVALTTVLEAHEKGLVEEDLI